MKVPAVATLLMALASIALLMFKDQPKSETKADYEAHMKYIDSLKRANSIK